MNLYRVRFLWEGKKTHISLKSSKALYSDMYMYKLHMHIYLYLLAFGWFTSKELGSKWYKEESCA